MTLPRRFMCGEGDYLVAHNIDLHHAARFARRYGPAAIRELVEAGITPEQANGIEARDASEIVHLLSPRRTDPWNRRQLADSKNFRTRR